MRRADPLDEAAEATGYSKAQLYRLNKTYDERVEKYGVASMGRRSGQGRPREFEQDEAAIAEFEKFSDDTEGNFMYRKVVEHMHRKGHKYSYMTLLRYVMEHWWVGYPSVFKQIIEHKGYNDFDICHKGLGAAEQEMARRTV